MKLELEPIPEKSWGYSLARLLPTPVWDSLRRDVYRRYDYTCAICGATNTQVQCHEVWGYHDRKRIQYLKGLQCLCANCHCVKHWGRTVVAVHKGQLPQDYLERLTEHFCKVNKCSKGDFDLHKVKVGNKHQKRTKHQYKIDFGKFTPENLIRSYRKIKGE